MKQRLRNRDNVRQSPCTFPADITKPKKPKEIRKRRRCRLCRGKYADMEKHLDKRHPEHGNKMIEKRESAAYTQESTAHVDVGKDSAQTVVTRRSPADVLSLPGNAPVQAQLTLPTVFTLISTQLYRNTVITPDEPRVSCTSGPLGVTCGGSTPPPTPPPKSSECGSKKRPHPSSAEEGQLVQSVEEAQSLPSVKRKRGRPASTPAVLPGERPQPCFFCDRMIVRMGEHINTVHPELACNECNKDFSTVKDLLSHITEFHPIIVPLALSAQEEAINFMKRTGFMQYKCSRCLAVFPSKLLLDLHDYHHTGNTDVTLVPPQCPECEFTGTTFLDLLQHVSWHALGKRQKTACLLCDFRTPSMKSHLRTAHPAEMQIITEKWRFECLECQEKYLKKSALHQHIHKVHKGYLCLCCGARVFGTAVFDQHVTEHRVDDAFQCRLCGRSCPEYRGLQKHFGEEHREDVRVQCRLCHTVYKTAERLAIHMKKRHNLAECRQANGTMEADNRLPVSDLSIDAVGTVPETSRSSPKSVYLGFVSMDEPGTDADVSGSDGAVDEEEAGNIASSFPTTTNKRKRPKKSYKFKRRCQLCDGKFFDREQHMRDAHPDCEDPNPYACMHCPLKFSSEAYLRLHARNQAHPLPTEAIPPAALEEAIEHIKTTGTFSYYCSKCRVSYPTKRLLLQHEFIHVTDGMEEGLQRDCPECGYTASSFKELASHIPQHGAKPHDLKRCLLCGDSCTSLKAHVRHGHSELMKRIGEGWEYECKECGGKFKRKSDLEIHLKSAHNGFQCWYCAKILYTATEFGIHVQEHKVNGVFPCPSCAKLFPSYPGLNNHYRAIHDMTNPRTCEICQTVCISTRKLTQHMYKAHKSDGKVKTKRKYNNETCKKGRGPDGRYHCEQCGLALASYGSLYKHKRWMHTGDYKEKFYQKKAEEKAKGVESRWRTYVKPKHRLKWDEFAYQCQECQMGFVYKGHLIKHNETCHKEQPTVV